MDRRELRLEIKANSERSAIRGNVIWTLKDGKIACHHLKLVDGNWIDEQYSEADHPPHLSCPETLLNDTEPVNPEWRKQVVDRWKQFTNKKIELYTLFKEKEDDETIQVTLQAKPGFMLWFETHKKSFATEGRVQKSMKFDIVKVVGIEHAVGRSIDDHRLYRIPYRMIKEIIKKKKGEIK